MAPDTLPGALLLVVEDNEVTREGLAFVLRRAGCAVTLASEGAQALALLRAGLRPNLILLDMLLPAVDGWGLLDERKRDPALAAVPVVIMTALSIACPEWAASLGAAGLLHKPIETGALLAEVRRRCPR
jgi:CheY-like chemotaxis protein